MMKFKSSLTAMIGDFANMNRNPDFKAKSETTETSSSPERGPAPGARRHSLNITVGAEALPTIPRRNRSESICATSTKIPPELLKGARRCSAPAVSSSSATASFKSKLKKLRKKNDDKSDNENDVITEAEEEEIFAKMAEREKRPSSYLL